MEPDNLNAPPAAPRFRPGRKTALALTMSGLFVGSLIGGAAIANAANNPSLTATPAAGSAPADRDNDSDRGRPAFDPAKGGHVGRNGVVEKLLTGSAAANARAAALAAVPGATIERVENDAEGAVYEAHMVKSDGSHVTVKMDANFKVTKIETGPDGPGGPRP